jgi:hypothetical protein
MIALISASILACVALDDSTTLRLRGGEETPSGMIAVGVTDAGVLLGPSDQNSAEDLQQGRQPVVKVQVGWDRVESVQGWLAPQGAKYADLAILAWRGRVRLERGDWISAEPLLEQVFPRVRGRSGPTAGVVSEALARARLRRGAHLLAIEPFLSLLQSGAGPASTIPSLHAAWASEAGLGVLVDPELQIAPALPPIWVHVPALDAFAANASLAAGWEAGAAPGSPPSRVTFLALLYLEAAKHEAGLPAAMPPIKPSDAGVQLVSEVVAARIGTPEQRASARKLLRDRLRAIESPAPSQANATDESLASSAWIEAWVRMGLGRSLLREYSPDDRQAGVLQLLTLPARFGKSQPYLAGIALAEASAALRDLGDPAGADVLAAELFKTYPNHPAVDWEPMRLARPVAAPSAPNTSKDQSNSTP